MSAYPLQELTQYFFQDPRWSGVEELIRDFIEPLKDMSQIDTSKDAETVRAEVIGRMLAYKQLDEFLRQVKILGTAKLSDKKINPFR